MSASYPAPTTNASRIRRPAGVRTGMFCRFGSVLDNLPVAATIWLNVVWTRCSASASGISPATVWRSREASRNRSSASRTGCAVVA